MHAQNPSQNGLQSNKMTKGVSDYECDERPPYREEDNVGE